MRYIVFAHFRTFNHKLAIPIVLIKKKKLHLTLGLRHGFIFSGEDQRISSCASSEVSVISLTTLSSSLTSLAIQSLCQQGLMLKNQAVGYKPRLLTCCLVPHAES